MDNNGENNKMNKSGGPKAGPNKTNEDPTLREVLDKIQDAESVLVALSNDPTVDEIAAAMGLSMALDAIGKHVTAIYSGKTPNVLEFLKPRETFETGTESLQDFVIALNKDKADHLRYKIDGDFVKVYVTPYKSTISGEDIEFSRGDYNVDLVIALNVPAATELDAALSEHGRIMHDASSVNITNRVGGDFGDVEWVDENASSISEMVSKLAFALGNDMDSGTATALLTGLVAATDRFKNPETTPDAMVLAAKLMGAGADQQLVVQNVQGEVVFNGGEEGVNVVVPEAEGDGEEAEEDATHLEIKHDEDEKPDEQKPETDSPDTSEDSEDKAEDSTPTIQTGGGTILEPSNSELGADDSEAEPEKTEDSAEGGESNAEPTEEQASTPEIIAGAQTTDTETNEAPASEEPADANDGVALSGEDKPVLAAPTLDETTSSEETPAQDAAPTLDSTPTLGETPTLNDTSTPEQALTQEETPAQASAQEETPAQAPEVAPAQEGESASPEPANEPNDAEDPVKAAMEAAIGTPADVAPANNGTVAGVDVAVVPANADGYAGGELADQILNNIEKENSNVGSADYGKMIDEALNEPLPGEGGIQVGENGANGPVVDTQDVDKADVPEGNLMAMMDEEGATNASANLGAQMMANAGSGINGGPGQAMMRNNAGADQGAQAMANTGTDMNTAAGPQMGTSMIPQPQTSGMSEEEALDLIKQGQEESESGVSSLTEGGELPKIITGGGMGTDEQPVGMDSGIVGSNLNPAMAQTPGIETTEATGVPDMNFQGAGDITPSGNTEIPSAMPLPGQEMAPPPMTPMPDFGSMPPTTPDVQAPMPQVENTVPTAAPAQPANDVTVQPDMSMPVGGPSTMGAGAGLPQMPQVMGAGGMGSMGTEANSFQAPSPMMGAGSDPMGGGGDPGAFKIPGIHT